MREEKFKILQFIREFIVRVDKELENFPRKEIEIKNQIRLDSYELKNKYRISIYLLVNIAIKNEIEDIST